MSGLLPLDEAQARLLALAPSPRETVASLVSPHSNAYLAADVLAQRTQPVADLSAMDGYAIGAGQGPWHKIGESRAGAPFDGTVAAGQCTRISTGAHMPSGTDRVLIQENASIEGACISTTEIPPSGKHVRKAGFDFTQGDIVLSKGTALSPAAIALAASAGLGQVPVFCAPKVGVLDSGDELVPVGQSVGPYQLPASNGVMLGAMLAPLIGEPCRIGPVGDDLTALAQALERVEDCDILITSGGASVGDHDLIQQALKDWGADIAFWKVAIKPGKPLMVATRGSQVILGLPGNPVSSFVTAFLFALPLVRAAMGSGSPLPKTVPMPLGQDLPPTGKRREFLRAVYTGGELALASSQDSSALVALASANCLIDRPPRSPEAKAGTFVPAYLL